MQRGAPGHVAAPRGPARVSAWHDVTFIYIIYLLHMVIVRISYSIEEFCKSL